MPSIYQQALGGAFDRLHPRLQERFSFSSEDGVASIATGVMDELWHGRFYTLPFLYVGAWRRIMFPDQGVDVPFTLANYAYRDSFGRETLTWNRTFGTPKPRRFDEYMIYSKRRGCVVIYCGTHQHLAVDMHLSVDEQGGLHLRSGEQRFYERAIAFRFPLFFSGIADVHERFDEAIGRFRVDVRVTNRFWGPLFGYHGTYDARCVPVRPNDMPADIRPYREQQRE